MLSNTSKYGIKAVIYLAMQNHGEVKTGIKKISEELAIPTPFLSKILQLLAKHKILNSTKGPHGGFGLKKSPYDISLLDIIKVLDGEDIFENCLIGMDTCTGVLGKDYFCPVHNKYAPIRRQLYELFKNESIGSILDDAKESGKPIKI